MMASTGYVGPLERRKIPYNDEVTGAPTAVAWHMHNPLDRPGQRGAAMDVPATSWSATYVNKHTKADGSTYMEESTRPIAVWAGPNDGTLRGYVAREEGDRNAELLVAAHTLSGFAGYAHEPGFPIIHVLMENAIEQKSPWYEIELTTGTVFVGRWDQGTSGSVDRLGFLLWDQHITYVRTEHIIRIPPDADPPPAHRS
jgi:hypothetical protein